MLYGIMIVNLRETNSSDKNKDYKTIVSIFWSWSLLAKKTHHIWKYATHVGQKLSEKTCFQLY